MIYSLIFISGIGLGFFVSLSRLSSPFKGELHEGSDGFTNPLLECEFGENYISKGALKPFKIKAETYINGIIAEKKASTVSLYFRDLNNGPWFGINEDENFFPASLMKVPTMITILRMAEKNPNMLEKIIEFAKGDTASNQYFKPSDAVQVGKSYTVRELIERMIIQSDNNATALLVETIDEENLKKIYTELGINIPFKELRDYITTKRYASFFRILFNASYLSRFSSEEALRLLSSIEFTEGIRAGVPLNIIVSHKFGEQQKTQQTNSEEKQLHDCGIVYYPKHPYILCIMTRGTDFKQLAGVLRDISRFVFDEVDHQVGGGL